MVPLYMYYVRLSELKNEAPPQEEPPPEAPPPVNYCT